MGGHTNYGKVRELIKEIFATFSDLFGVQDNQDEDEAVDENIRLNLTEEADKQFNSTYGMIDLGMLVANESGVSYFEIIEHPAIHVLGLSTYLKAKSEKLEREHNKRNGNTK